jgi:hypothetical protein
MSNLRIDIASEFTGRRAFQQAEASTNSLDKAVNALSKKMAAAFSAYKIAQFGKESVKAFAADQKAAAVLAKTLENVGQGYQTAMVENYIAKTEALYGVLDEKLRPAFGQLVIATGDATKSQALLQTALDVSAGTGKDLESVTTALSKAYLGNTTALQRLGAGLSAAELKGKSFDQIISILNQNFTGQAATAADTYQGKIDRLNVAFDNMKETVGKGLVDAFSLLGQNSNFNGVINAMGSLATYISNTIVGIGVLTSQLTTLVKSIPGIGVLGKVFKFALDTSAIGRLQAIGAAYEAKKAANAKNTAATASKTVAIQKTQLTTAKALTKEAKDKAALDALSLKYLQTAKIFNDEQIQIAAALANGKLSTEDQIRLNLKKDILDLETAIQNKDVEGATALAAKIDLEYKQLGLYQSAEKTASSIADILKNIQPIDLINIKNLQDALAKLLQLNGLLSPAQQAQAAAGQAMVDKAVANILNTDLANAAAETDVTSILGTPFNPNVVSNYGVGNPNLQNVTVTIVDNTSGLISVVTDATQQASANGINTRLVRNTGGLSW